MDTIYALIAHVMMIGSILAMFLLMFIFIIKAKDVVEKTMRVLAISGGLLIFFGAKNIGTNIPELMLGSLDPTGGFLLNIVTYIFPAIAGSIVTHLLFKSIKNYNQNDNQKIYFLILISTLVTLMFTDIYLGSFSSDAEKSNIGMNVSFITGIILTLLFRIDIIKGIYGYVSNDLVDDLSIDKKTTAEEGVKKDSWKDKY